MFNTKTQHNKTYPTPIKSQFLIVQQRKIRFQATRKFSGNYNIKIS